MYFETAAYITPKKLLVYMKSKQKLSMYKCDQMKMQFSSLQFYFTFSITNAICNNNKNVDKYM